MLRQTIISLSDIKLVNLIARNSKNEIEKKVNEVQIEDQEHLSILKCILSRSYDSTIIMKPNQLDRSDLIIVEVNQPFCHLTGFRSEEAIGQSFVHLLRLDLDSSFLNQFNLNILEQNPFRVRMTPYLKDGTQKCLDNYFIPYHQYSDRSARWVAIQSDWTEITSSNQLSFLQSPIVDQPPKALFITTLKGIITHWNFEVSKLFQYSELEILGKDISILYENQCRSYFLNLINSLLKNGRSLYVRRKMKRKNGDIFDVNLCHSPLRDKEGNIIGITHNCEANLLNQIDW